MVYEITVTATGDQVASGVTITETVPDHTVFDAAGSTFGWVCVPDGSAGSVCTFNLGDLDRTSGPSNDGVVTVDFAVAVVSPVPAGVESTTNTASVTATNTDPETNVLNNADTEPTPIVASPDLVIGKVDDVATSAGVGDTVVYTLSVDNVGDQDAGDVTVTETVPVGSTFTATGSTVGWSCTGGGAAGETCTFTVGAIAGGASAAPIDFAVVVDDPLAAGIDDLLNVARVDDVTAEDETPADNDTTLNTLIDAAPDVAVTIDDGGVTATAGNPVDVHGVGDQCW